jgi:alkylation response protein AidB-like acyl-CoA dehydrogenase
VTLGISEEHGALHESARRWVATNGEASVARAAMEADADDLPPFWEDLAKLGWLGLAVRA